MALARREREILFGGSRGGGKSECGLAWLIEPEYIINPRFRGLVIRKSFKDLNDWTARARLMYHGMAEIFSMPAEIRFPSGAVVTLGHWGDPSALSSYIGKEFQKMLLEELTDIFSNENDYLKLLGSLRSSIPGLTPQVFATTNPGNVGHAWVKRRFVDVAFNATYFDPKNGQSRIFISSKLDDNPTLRDNDPSYVSYLDSLPERLRRAWRDGDWGLSEGSFFTDFNSDTMREPVFQTDETSTIPRLFGSMDIGASHATSFGLWYVKTDGSIHRMLSYCNKLKSIKDHALEIKRLIETHQPTRGYFPNKIWVGKDAWTKSKINEAFWRSPIDEFKDLFPAGTTFEEANDSRVNGCMIMQQLFKGQHGKPEVSYLDKYNQVFEDSIPAAQINPNKPEEYLKTSADADDVCFGAGTMIETESGPRPIESLVVGDKVVTRYGLRPIVRTLTREAELFDWHGTHMTNNHPIITQRGKVPVCDLTRLDTILLVSKESLWSNIWNKVITFTGGTLTVSREVTGYIGSVAQRLASGICMLMSGKQQMDLCLISGTSITRTETHQTIPWITSLSCLLGTISNYTVRPMSGSGPLGTSNTLRKQDHSQKSGMRPRTGLIGTRSITIRSRISSWLKRLCNVNSVKNLLKASAFKGFAQTSVSLPGVGSLVSMMSRSYASTAAKPRWLINTPRSNFVAKLAHRDSALVPISKSPVYNITVLDHHEYIANGVLVANCDEARYGLVGIYTWLTGQKTAKALQIQVNAHNAGRETLDWYNDL